MKLKALLALTAALSFGALAQDATAPEPVAPAITDVPAGHWAKDAVDELVSRRIIIGFPDGTFRGSENLTRYQAAVMIQRLLEQVAAREVVLPTDPELLITLQNAVQELASDLAALGVRVADLEDNGVARDDFAALEDRASGFEDNLSDLTARLEALEGMEPVEPGEPVDLTAVEDRLMALEDSQATQDDTLTDHEDRIAALEDVVANLEIPEGFDSTEIEDRIVALEDSQAVQDDTLADVDSRIAALEEGQVGQGDQIVALEESQVAQDDQIAALEEGQVGQGDQIAVLEEGQVAQGDQIAALEEGQVGQGDQIVALEESQLAQDDILADVDSRIAALEEGQVAQGDLIVELDGRLGDAEASLDEVRAALDDNAAVDEELQAAIDELRDGLDATTDAADTALAQARDLQDALDTLTERTDALEGSFSDLAADVESNTSSITALNDLTVLLNQDILDLQDQVAAVLARLDDTDAANAAQFDALGGQITDLSDTVDGRFDDLQADVDSRFDSVYTEIDGLRAFDDVIRRDVDVLTGRVTVNETRLSDLDTKVGGIDTRLTTLENNVGFTIGGSLGFNYYASALSNRDFDIDRILPGTKLSTGNPKNGDGKNLGSPSDYTDFGTRADIDAAAINGFAGTSTGGVASKEGAGAISLDLSVNFKNRALSGGSTDVNGLAAATPIVNPQQIVAKFGIRSSGNLTSTTGQALSFYVEDITSNFKVGTSQISLNFGVNPKFKFSDYVFDNDNNGRGPGVVATIDGSDIAGIGGLKPKITAVYGSKGGADNTDSAGAPIANAQFGYFGGVRAEIELQGLKLGLNYAVEGGDGLSPSGNNFDAVNGKTTVFGANASGTNVFSTGLNLQSEYATSTNTKVGGAGESVFYARADGTLGPITINDVNFRRVSPGFNGAAGLSEANAKDGNSTAPYKPDQQGFGVSATVKLPIGSNSVSLTGYVDQQTNFAGTPASADNRFGAEANLLLSPITLKAFVDSRQTATAVGGTTTGIQFGVDASVKLFAGLGLGGKYTNVSLNGAVADDTAGYLQRGWGNANGFNDADSRNLENGYEVRLTHDGKASDALIKDLNLLARYGQFNKDLSRAEIEFAADYATRIAPINIELNAGYLSQVDSKAGTDDIARIQAGAKVSTDTLNAPFKPSLEGVVGYYSNNHSDLAVYNANSLNFRVTARLGEFFVPNSTFAASYAAWSSNNRKFVPNRSADKAGTFADDATAGATTLNGYYLEWNFFDANLSFGDFTLVGKGETSRAQAFKIQYRVSL